MTGTDALPFVTVIVPVWNGGALIRGCVASLEAQTYPRDRYEIIVVDNGSTDDTADIVRAFPEVRLMFEPVASSYRARNLALTAAAGELVAFTDADCVAASDWIRAGVALFGERPDTGVAAGRIEFYDTGAGAKMCSDYDRIFATFDQEGNARAGWAVTANWMSWKSVVDAVGGFDSTLKSIGDSDLARRIRNAGHPIVYAPDMLVRHPTRASFAELAAKRRRVLGGRWTKDRATRGFGFWLTTVVREIGSGVRKTVRAEGFGFRAKLAVVGVVMALGVVQLSELFRLALGGDARRG